MQLATTGVDHLGRMPCCGGGESAALTAAVQVKRIHGMARVRCAMVTATARRAEFNIRKAKVSTLSNPMTYMTSVVIA
jgi:hypothetical protein